MANLNDINKLVSNDELIQRIAGYISLQQRYQAAIKEVVTKLEILDDEFHVKFDHNPIHHMEQRLKSPASIIEKLQRKGLAPSIDAIRENILDFAGVRVICNYIDDIYKIADLLVQQDDITLVKSKDYIATPKENGYRSLHLVVAVPVFLSSERALIPVEVQIRTTAMDFWASLEHQMRYKSATLVPPDDQIRKELADCALAIAEIDERMQRIYKSLQ